MLQVDLEEFTTRLHAIASNKPAWLPQIRAVVATTAATKLAAAEEATAAAKAKRKASASAAVKAKIAGKAVKARQAQAHASAALGSQKEANTAVNVSANAELLSVAIDAKNSELFELQQEMLNSPRSQRKNLKAEIAALDSEIAELQDQRKEEATREEAMTDEEARVIFELFDADGNGTVDIDELVVFVKAFKQSDDVDRAQVEEVWDKDKNGTVSALQLYVVLLWLR